MCGLAGLWLRKPDAENLERRIASMTSSLSHRGPDDQGTERVYQGVESELWFGHARLAILDQTAAAQQPMRDPGTGNWIVFNGEIYNHREIRTELNGDRAWRSHSDTETVLHAYTTWGTDCVTRLRGMFAFALWDATRRVLWCARDRFGVKPFYFAQTSAGFVFASELRTLLQSGLVEPTLDEKGLAGYVRFGSVCEPFTMIAGVHALHPATWMEVKAASVATKVRYWQPLRPERSVVPNRESVCTQIRQHLERSVREHLLADVPVASFLSGGIDSSVVTALAARESSRQLKTFTIGFADESLDERRHAAEVARRCNTDHHEVLLSNEEAAALVPRALAAMDQPTADGLNTYIVARAAALRGVKVALSGLGGDEVFGGYRSFRILPLARHFARFMGPLAHSSLLARVVPGGQRSLELLRRHASLVMRYESLRSYWSRDELHRMKLHAFGLHEHDETEHDVLTRISLLELNHYLRNVLLRDSDMMSAAHSLELRVPFLDHELVECALANRVAGHGIKTVLIEATRDLLPRSAVRRQKRGFVLPMDSWMRGPLREHVHEGLRLLRRSQALPFVPLATLEERFAAGKLGWARLWQFVVLGHWVGTVLGERPLEHGTYVPEFAADWH